jgi:hypothetical protein
VSERSNYFFLGNVLFSAPESKRDLRGKNKKNCLTKMEGEKVHLRMIEKRRLSGLRPAAFEAPVAKVLFYLNRDFG